MQICGAVLPDMHQRKSEARRSRPICGADFLAVTQRRIPSWVGSARDNWPVREEARSAAPFPEQRSGDRSAALAHSRSASSAILSNRNFIANALATVVPLTQERKEERENVPYGAKTYGRTFRSSCFGLETKP